MGERLAPATVVQAWQDAANAQDVERVLALSHEDVAVAGPRGGGQGHQLLREWLSRAGIKLLPLRAFGRGDTVVVEQQAIWRSSETGEVTGQQVLASVFLVTGGRVVRVARYGSLPEALRAAELSDADRLADA